MPGTKSRPVWLRTPVIAAVCTVALLVAMYFNTTFVGAGQQAVAADTAQANGFGANSTPVFSVNGVPIVGAQDLGQFTQVVDAAAQVQAGLKG